MYARYDAIECGIMTQPLIVLCTKDSSIVTQISIAGCATGVYAGCVVYAIVPIEKVLLFDW